MAEAQGSYTDVSGVVDATAAPEVAAIETELLSFLPQEGVAGSMPPPDYCDIPIHTAEKLRAEITAAFAAIAAAPTA